ncbi:hypothetical protein [Halorarum halobium]|uniref:hypothetical protein n=1 Tax=Halorarum halobium TaxID=3075121 RepID=UPI0028B00E8E|nr:hypothetical protein [Halobaculum sp. XH14]
MNPRTLLLLVAVALLAGLSGCSAAGSLHMTAVNDTELAAEASRDLPDSDERPAVRYREIVETAVENGSATANDTAPFVEPGGPPYAVDGAYYDISAEPVGNHTERMVDVKVDYNGSTDGPAVAYEDLTPADRALLDTLLPPPADHSPTAGYDLGSGQRYTRAEANESVLVSGEYDAVHYEGERYPIAVDSTDVTVTTYRYTATEIAPSAEAYASDLRETYRFELSGLSEAERGVVSEAIESSYYAESTDDEAFRSVMERFRAVEGVRVDEYGGSWVVEYRGAVYWAELQYGGFLEEEPT